MDKQGVRRLGNSLQTKQEINVVWNDDTENEYTNATHMYWKLKEFGRD